MQYSKTRLSAVRLMIFAALAFSVMVLSVKKLSAYLPSMEIVFIRSLLGCLLVLAAARVQKISVSGFSRGRLALRGLYGFAALALHFYTISKLPLGTAVLLNYTAPLFILVFSLFFLREKTHPAVPLLVGLSFFGVFLLIEGGLGIWGADAFWGILSAVFSSFAYLTISSLKRREKPLTIVFYFTAISTLGSSVCFLDGFVWPKAADWPYLAGVALGSYYGQLWMTIALRRAPASLVSPFSYLTPLLSFFYGLIFFGEKIAPLSLAGAVTIIVGGCLLSHYGTLRKPSRSAWIKPREESPDTRFSSEQRPDNLPSQSPLR
ncbi:MAG: DMT family transporter [Candidatus Omnitrophica bacterium]|nr:DMT family transporter [Candidatus Omnitrophota bacterium]